MKTVKQACRFNPIIQNYSMREGIDNLSELIRSEGDGKIFFSRNVLTDGMKQLVRQSLLRLSGKSDQAVFELSQAMGGGKTHMMIALGLLACYPKLRDEVLPESLRADTAVNQVHIATFSGRNNPENYIWGDIATQLDQEAAIKPFWASGPKALDQNDWKNIIGNEPTLILFDELPAYLNYASTQSMGSGTLANIVIYSLSNLLHAALELPRCCIVLANLSGSYQKQSRALKEAISDLQQETRRQAVTITPVQLAGNEIYDILKKRLIDELPSEEVIDEVADTYAKNLKKAIDSGHIATATLTQIAQQIRDTYPFHPSFKYLVALFKENEGFRQTRGLMQFTAKLLKNIAERKEDDVFLIGAQHLALNDNAVKDEIQSIAPQLMSAVTHDIADNGHAVAENIDKVDGHDIAQQIMALLLTSSLSHTIGGQIGLTEHEMLEFLLTPSYSIEQFREAFEKMREQTWYLHRQEGRFFIKETENLSRRIEREAKEISQSKIDDIFITKLTGFLKAEQREAYQEVHILPRLADLKLTGSRKLIVIKPDGKVPPEVLQNFFQHILEKNNLLILTGQDSHLAATAEERLRELCAIEQLRKIFKSGDTHFEEVEKRLEEAQDKFEKSLAAAYDRIYFPSLDLDNPNEAKLVPVIIDGGLKLGSGKLSAEEQIQSLLASEKAFCKLASDYKTNYKKYWQMAETYLWPSASNNRAPWQDILRRSKESANWPWIPGINGMDELKKLALLQGRWRTGSDQYLEKGPFPKEKATLNITVESVNEDASILCITPQHAGANPQIFYAKHKEELKHGQQVDNFAYFVTQAGSLYFLAVDPTQTHESAEPIYWTAQLKIRHQVSPVADKRAITLACTPKAELFYTLDGSHPKSGQRYQEPIPIGQKSERLLVYAKLDEANQQADFTIPASGDQSLLIKDNQPAILRRNDSIYLDTITKIYDLIQKFRDQDDWVLGHTRLEIGKGDNAVVVRFGARQISCRTLETIIEHLRSVFSNDADSITLTIAHPNIHFKNGLDLKAFAKLVCIDIKSENIVQDN